METKTNYLVDLPKENIYDSKCPILFALEIIGQKWKLPIMWRLAKKEATRYNELKRGVTGITNMMLTKSLQELEKNQLIVRYQYDTIPPKVEYSLTDRGKALLPTLNELYHWGKEQLEIEQIELERASSNN